MPEVFQIFYWILVWAFLIYSVLVSVFDLRTRRIDNRFIGAGLIIGFSLAISRCVLLGTVVPLLSALAGFLVCFGIYFLIHLLRSEQFGAGDVKLAAVVGLFVGSLGFAESIIAVLGGFVFALPAAIYYLFTGDRTFKLPFAPFLLGSCWLVFTLYSN
jgi:leader peptidase (prepilin peptidase)/N-methyltransferase